MDHSPNETQVSQTIGMLKHEIDLALKASNEYNDNFVGKIDMVQLNRLETINNMLKGAMKDIIELEKLYNDQLNNNFTNIENDAVCQLEETLKREKETRKIIRHNLLKFVSDLIDNSDCDTIFDTDGDQKEVFVRTTDNRLFIIDKYLLGHIIRVLLEIADTHVIKDESNNAIHAYFIYNGNIFEVGCVVGQGTYEYFRRVVDINEKDVYIKILNLKKVYDYYMENINYD